MDAHVNALVAHLFKTSPASMPMKMEARLADWVEFNGVKASDTWVSGAQMLENVLLARDYVLSRTNDAAKALATFDMDFRPTTVESGRVVIHNPYGVVEKWVAQNRICALAFVLARYW